MTEFVTADEVRLLLIGGRRSNKRRSHSKAKAMKPSLHDEDVKESRGCLSCAQRLLGMCGLH
jgi:hypothetical protein